MSSCVIYKPHFDNNFMRYMHRENRFGISWNACVVAEKKRNRAREKEQVGEKENLFF